MVVKRKMARSCRLYVVRKAAISLFPRLAQTLVDALRAQVGLPRHIYDHGTGVVGPQKGVASFEGRLPGA